MRRLVRVTVVLLVLLYATLLLSCTTNRAAEPVPEPPDAASEAPDTLRKAILDMRLDEKIGQMVMAGVEGLTPGQDAQSLVRDYKVGGFILMSRNIKSASQTLELLNSLRRLNEGSQPLFLSVDEEGGRVSRLPADIMKLPSSRLTGRSGNESLAFATGEILAQQVKALGYNMDFAPVLDINSNPKNPVIGDRALGATEPVVSRLGVQVMLGVKSKGVIPVVKHFPGHGDTAVDSHEGLPVIDHDLDRLAKFELVPFARAVERGADAIMVAHVLLSKVDPENPASLSRAVVSGLLRDRLGFRGVVITDDMTMGAIEKNYSLGEAAVRAVEAGVDIVLICHGYDNQIAAVKALLDAVASGRIPRERIDESVYRILALKHSYGLEDRAVNPDDLNALNKAISDHIKRLQG